MAIECRSLMSAEARQSCRVQCGRVACACYWILALSRMSVTMSARCVRERDPGTCGYTVTYVLTRELAAELAGLAGRFRSTDTCLMIDDPVLCVQ